MSTALNRLKCIEMMDKKLSTYKYLQRSLSTRDVITDKKYQKAFKSFYVVRREEKWCDMFFSILEREKSNRAILFSSVLKKVFAEVGQVEASFCSKLVATINPDLPVWDQNVLAKLGLKRPPGRDLRPYVKVYSHIETWSGKAIREDCFKAWKKRFDDLFPQFQCFTDMKKLDLFLWQSQVGATMSVSP